LLALFLVEPFEESLPKRLLLLARQLRDFFEQLHHYIHDMHLATQDVIHVCYGEFSENLAQLLSLLLVLTFDDATRAHQNLIRVRRNKLRNRSEILRVATRQLEQLHEALGRDLDIVVPLRAKLRN